VLIGKQQQQTVGPSAGEHHDYYYTCLSHVSINGALLSSALQQSSAVLNGRPTAAAVPTVAKAAKALRASVVASFVYFNSSGESQYDDASTDSEGAGCRPF
jgi:CHASE2 domain-containing sensor protein